MKHILLCLIIIFNCYSISIAQKKEDPIVASIKSHQITLSHFEKRYSNFLLATGMKDNYSARKSVLNNMINEILLYYYDYNEDIFNDDEYQKEIEWTRKQAVISYLKDQQVYAKISVSEGELREAFLRSNEQLAARHLWAPVLEEANNLYQLLQVGVDFELLAKQTFTDSVLQNNGGYLGYFGWGDMDPAFEEVAFSMNVGEISPPVKTALGYSIIKLEDRFSNPLLTENEFQNNKTGLERAIKIRKKIPAEREYINKIFDETKLRFDEKNIDNILSDLLKFDMNNLEKDRYEPSEIICVEYEGEKYNRQEIEQRLLSIPSYHFLKLTTRENIKSAIKGLLIQERLYQAAQSLGYDTAAVVNEAFQQLRTNLFMNYKKKDVVEKYDLPDSLVYKYYKSNINLFSTPQQINVQEIIVDDKQLADSLESLIEAGEDFGRLASEFSLRTWSAQNSGIMGLAPLSKFGIFKQILWDSSLDKIVGTLKIEDYYGIFRVLEKRESNPIDYSVIKGKAREMAKMERQNSFFMDYIGKLRQQHQIKIDEQILSNYKLNLEIN
ncbi:MAG: hypothetical protein A2V66_05235 [Ignavibacteria bacterium RBG_13_36_8]|nr:MAG: hypothetical protein A2V66_05235 [Ignavibacteria bacterium RBG_13_36_8]